MYIIYIYIYFKSCVYIIHVNHIHAFNVGGEAQRDPSRPEADPKEGDATEHQGTLRHTIYNIHY